MSDKTSNLNEVISSDPVSAQNPFQSLLNALELEQFKLLLDVLYEGLWIMDHKARIVFVTQKLANLLGYTREEIYGKHMSDFMDSQGKAIYHDFLKHASSPGLEQKDFELITKDGQRLFVMLQIAMFLDPQKKLQGIVTSVLDVTERKEMEALVRRNYESQYHYMEGIIMAMSESLESRDHKKSGHIKRVMTLATALAGELNINDRIKLTGLRLAAILHDFGKFQVPAEILNKTGRLTEQEMALMQTHVQTGYDIFKAINFPYPISDIILQHHERMDGSGYPLKLTGEEILLEARILAVADVVEAMSAPRAYREVLGVEAALNELTQFRGKKYDPAVVDACIRLFKDKGFSF